MKFVKYLLFSLLGILALGIVWGLSEPYFIDEQQETAVIPNLPPAWEGQEIDVVSDFQIGMWMDNTNTMRRSVARMIEERPAAVMIVGDFIYHSLPNPSEEIGKAIDIVRPLVEAGIPTYAVLGNHDYAMKSKNGDPDVALANQLERELEAIGIPVLQNEAATLSLPQEDAEPLYIIGIGADWPDRDRPQIALADVPEEAPRIVMMHNPNSFPQMPANSAPLAVAGHTHGGQIRLPFTPEWSWLTFAKEDAVHADGWIPAYGKEGNSLYVNRGIGFSTVPLRINCPPEVTIFTLNASE